MKAIRKSETVDYFIYGTDPEPDWFLRLPRETVFDADGHIIGDIDTREHTTIETDNQSIKAYKGEYIIKDEHANIYTLGEDIFNMAYVKLQQDDNGTHMVSDELLTFANDICNETLEFDFENRLGNLKYLSLSWNVSNEQHNITDFICEKIIHKVQSLQDNMIVKELQNNAIEDKREITLLYIEY